MAEAGIRELRDHLSKYIDRVRAGEELVVTDRGTAVARLVPMSPRPYERLVDEGVVEPAEPAEPGRSRTRPGSPVRAEESISDLVGDQRR